jgi:LmbE family N-acetylglucosaminyl deacetylase
MASLLVVFAHPDDEAFGVAGTVAHYAERGVPAHLLTFTKGQRGTMPEGVGSPEALGALREFETRASARVLGAADVEVLDYMDGELDQVDVGELAGHVSRALAETGADTIISFGPTGITRHGDHIAAHRAVMAAAESARGGPVRVLWAVVEGAFAEQLQVSGPETQATHRLDVSPYLERKLAALACHSSQQDAREYFEELRKATFHEELYHQALPAASGSVSHELYDL